MFNRFITKKKHDAIVESWRNRVWSESNLADRYMVERDKALAELSAIKIDGEPPPSPADGSQRRSQGSCRRQA